MKELCKIEILLEGGNTKHRVLGERIKGEFIITPFYDLPVSMIGYDLIGEVRGKTATETQGVLNEYVGWNKLLKANETYHFPINFVNKSHETYSGIDLNCLIKFEVYLKIDRMKALQMTGAVREFYGKFNWGKEKKIAKGMYLNFGGDTNKYLLKTKDFKLSIESYLKYIWTFIVTGLVTYSYSEKTGWKFAPFFGAGALLILLHHLLGVVLIGKMKGVFTKNSGEQFQVKFTNSKSWKTTQKLSVKYEVREQVVDGRGTSTVTYDNAIFTSPSQNITEFKKGVLLDFDFPKGFPPTSTIADAKIYWVLKVKIKTKIGLSFSFNQEIIVNKYKV